MKKTIIASAIAAVVAAPAAFADVTISGMVNMERLDNGAGTGANFSTNTDLVFTASEDLGNGMKAAMKYHYTNDDGGMTTAQAVADTSVTLSGDFGALTVGRMETINQSYFHPFAAGDAAHDMTLEDANGQQGRVNAVAYASPSFNGLTVMGALVQMTAGTQGVDTNDTDATEIAAKYSNGGLTVAAGRTIHKGSVADETITNIAASYNMGDLTFAILNRDVEDDGNVLNADNELTTVSVKYAMGSNTLYAGFNDSDDGQDGDYVVSFAHNLSKRTSAYVAYKHDDTPAAGLDEGQTLIGLQHTF
jgi:predicted porin